MKSESKDKEVYIPMNGNLHTYRRWSTNQYIVEVLNIQTGEYITITDIPGKAMSTETGYNSTKQMKDYLGTLV